MNEAMLEAFSKSDMVSKNVLYMGFRKGNKKTSGKHIPGWTTIEYDLDTPLGLTITAEEFNYTVVEK